jgi:hypothetical protein
MAGIEPASEKFDRQTSTSLAGLFSIHRRVPGRRGPYDDYPMAPERAAYSHLSVSVRRMLTFMTSGPSRSTNG